MRTDILVAAALACLTGAVAAQHEHSAPAPNVRGERPPMRAWTQQPLLLGKAARGERAIAVLLAQNLAAERVAVFAAEGPADRLKVDYPVDANGARIEAVTPKIGNYHWAVAREERDGEVRVASTAWHFGNPGASPKDLLKAVRHELEIVPEPLPREHASYRESEKWRFLVRLHGQPLPAQPLTLETEFGSRSTFLTDAAGIATVLFPRDFKPPVAGEQAGHGPRRAAFVLSTSKEADGRRYLTAFNHSYGQDGDRDKSLGWGALFGLAGMAAAAPLLRRRNNGASNHA